MPGLIRTNIDTSTNKDFFKNLLRKMFDNTAKAAIQEFENVTKHFHTSDEYEREYRIAGLGLAAKVNEGANIPVQTPKADAPKDWTQVAYGTAFRITERMMKFEKYGLMERYTKSLAKVMKETKDIEIARMFNNATATTYASGYDGLALAHDSHTCLDDSATTYDNYGDNALGVSTLQSALYYFDTLYNDQGQLLIANPTKLVVNPQLRITANQLLRSTGVAFEESNTINVYPDWDLKIFVYHRLTSSTSWFLLADKDDDYDYKVFTTKEPTMGSKDAPDTTLDKIVYSNQYFVYGFGDPRLCYCGDT